MKKKTYLIPTILILSLLYSCMPKSNNKHLNYQNVIILSDMSGRLSNSHFPCKDLDEIHKIVKYFEKECVKPGEKIGDKSSICFSAFSDRDFAKIDLTKIKNLGDKQCYINSTGEYKEKGLKKDLEEFEKKVHEKYDNIRDNIGLDLLSILLEKIETGNIIKKDEAISDGIDTTFIHFDNHIYIFTDGYLEYALKNRNNQFRFGERQISTLRSNSLNQKKTIEELLNKNDNLGLPAIKKEQHNLINIHIVETHERDFNTKNSTYNHPIGLRDNEILKSVWEKWVLDSGFKSFEWKKY